MNSNSKIYKQIIHSPLGEVEILATKTHVLSLKVVPNEMFSHDITSKLQDIDKANVNENIAHNDITQQVAQQLSAYFAGKLTKFDLPIVFNSNPNGFSAKVCETLFNNCQFANTITYKELAMLVANPKASRAVGNAMATNPNPLIVPCHRVLASDGSLGGFLYGLQMKKWLLNHEKAFSYK